MPLVCLPFSSLLDGPFDYLCIFIDSPSIVLDLSERHVVYSLHVLI